MKSKIISAVLLIILLAGCGEKGSKIKLLPNYTEDQGYMSDKELGAAPYPDTSNMYAVIDKAKELVKDSNYTKVLTIEQNKYPFYYRIYVNEKGNIEKVRVLYRKIEEIDKLLAKDMESWKYPELKQDGKTVKYYTDFSFKIPKPGTEFTGPIIVNPGAGKIDYKSYFIAAEQMPKPIGGIKAIMEKIQYPKLAKLAGIQGKVFVKAFVNESGDVVATQILKGIGSGCDESAADAVRQTKFIPAKDKGKNIKMQVVIPVYFKLE